MEKKTRTSDAKGVNSGEGARGSNWGDMDMDRTPNNCVGAPGWNTYDKSGQPASRKGEPNEKLNENESAFKMEWYESIPTNGEGGGIVSLKIPALEIGFAWVAAEMG